MRMTIEMFDIGSLGSQPTVEPPKRNRSREGCISSENSWLKHDLLAQAIQGQMMKYIVTHPGHLVLGVDGNAGDGHGVLKLQLDWERPNMSPTTSDIFNRLKCKYPHTMDAVLCEKDLSRREELVRRYQGVAIIGNNSAAPEHVLREHRYGLWSSDPTGAAGHNIDAMIEFSKRLPSDFVVVVNFNWLNRFTNKANARLAPHQKYSWMSEPAAWADKLNRRHVWQTPLYTMSASFHYRVLVIANYISDGVKRRPFEAVR